MRRDFPLEQVVTDSVASRRHQQREQYRRGVEFFRLGELKTGAEALGEAVRLDPGHADSWFYLGEVRRLLGDEPGATTAYRKCVEADREHSRVHARLRR